MFINLHTCSFSFSLGQKKYSADYTIIDKGGNYRGYISDDGDTVSRHDRNNMPDGWLDKDSRATFDGHNNFQGWVLDDNDDD